MKKKIVLSPMLSFIVMSGFVIILSGILSFLHVQTDYQTVNPVTNSLTTNVVEVESLFSLSGLKYIVTNAVSDFVSFAPLSMLIITLIGIPLTMRTWNESSVWDWINMSEQRTGRAEVESINLCIIWMGHIPNGYV